MRCSTGTPCARVHTPAVRTFTPGTSAGLPRSRLPIRTGPMAPLSSSPARTSSGRASFVRGPRTRAPPPPAPFTGFVRGHGGAWFHELHSHVPNPRVHTRRAYDHGRDSGGSCHLLLTAYYSLLTTCYLLLATCYLLLATYYLLLATCYLLLATCYLLLTTCYLLLTTYSQASIRSWTRFGRVVPPVRWRRARATACKSLSE